MEQHRADLIEAIAFMNIVAIDITMEAHGCRCGASPNIIGLENPQKPRGLMNGDGHDKSAPTSALLQHYRFTDGWLTLQKGEPRNG